MTSSKYNAHTNPTFKNIGLLILDIFKLQQLEFYFKLVNKILPEYFNAIPIVHKSDSHTYHTRN